VEQELSAEQASRLNGDLAGAVRILAKMRYYQNISERLAELKFRFHLQGFND